MMRYILSIICVLCMANGFAQRSKMSPLVRQAARDGAVAMSGAKGLMATETPTLTAFVQTTDKAVLRQHGCRVLAQWDDIYIASIPLTEIDALAAEKQVMRIEAGKNCMATNDTTAAITHARDLWSIPPTLNQADGYTGKDVVVGVMDVGFDLTNPTYYSPDGQTYRVKRMWDMLDNTQGGEEVTGDDIEDAYYVGRQYIGYDSLMRKQHSTDGIIQYHGTHTSGTAAGSGAPFLCKDGDVVYSGMAPEADICLVSNYVGGDESFISEEDDYKYNSATDMLGFKYIFDYADSVGKPCVINFSEGNYEDLYHSGLYNKVMKQLVGPGHIICCSAGNEGNKGSYVHKAKGETKKGAFLKASSYAALYVLRSTQPPVITLNFYDSSSTPQVWTYDCEALRNYPDSVFQQTVTVGRSNFDVLLNMYPSCYNDSLFATDMYVVNDELQNIGDSDIPYVALVLTGKDNDVEAIANGGYFISRTVDLSLRDYTSYHSVLFPAALDDVICVGATGYRNSFTNIAGYKCTPWGTGSTGGKIFYMSSKGPSMNGNLKPDVVAPGMYITSTMSSFYDQSLPDGIRDYFVGGVDYNGRNYPYLCLAGTSMAAPVVTGIVAQWLQACPTMTPDDVRDVIAHSSRHYNESMTWPNNIYGYGEIDAKAGLDYIHKTFFAAADVNKDGAINISDVNADISVLCGGTRFAADADVNGDGAVNISDVNAIITALCGGDTIITKTKE